MHQAVFPNAYLILNIDPVLQLGPLAIHWYGLAYVVGISVGLWVILRYAHQLGLSVEQVFRVFWWAALGGLLGGRLYFVLQQPDLVQHYLEQPLNILAVWNGGMAFFGAIFLGLATVAVFSWRQHVPIWLAFDVAAVFAAVGQIFGRVGNLINGDILGYQAGTLATRPSLCTQAPCFGFVADPHIVPWAMVYANPHAFAPLYMPFQPAAAYEMLMNLILLALLLPLRAHLPRLKMGLLSLVYLAGYALSQIVVFFFRGTEPITPFLGITIFKQAQWTGIILLLALIPYGVLLLRTSRPWSGWTEPGVSAHRPVLSPQNESMQAEPRPHETRTVLPSIEEEAGSACQE